jgi:signal transduction histidine kinase
LVEENEALQYLHQTLEGYDYQGSRKLNEYSTFSVPQIDSITDKLNFTAGRAGSLRVQLSDRHGKASIEETSRYLQEKFRQNFSRSKTILDQAVFRWLNEAENKEISERVNFAELNTIIEKFLTNNSVNLPFYYTITDAQGRILYRCDKNMSIPANNEKNANNTYKQRFFPSENSSRVYYLKVIFPTKQNYIQNSLKIFYPAVLLIAVVLGIFVMTLIIILRQKKVNTIKNDFINNMTHELKTPISSISLASQMLQDSSVGKTPKLLAHISKVIGDETNRLSFMVEKVLQMAVFEKEKSFLNLKEVTVNSLLKEIVENFSLKITSKGGQITTSFLATNDRIFIDEMHFTNVIFNLMDNALKYCDKPLLLTVETWNDKKSIYISIEDNGIGISKDDQKRIFERFYRVSTGNTHNIKGFGLGLAYVKKIITEHKGHIKVESEPNIGTKFIISIPTI